MKLVAFLLLGFAAIQAAHAEEPVVVIANQTTPVEKVTPDQAAQIFLRQIQTWPDGTAIAPVDLKEGSPQRNEFYSKVTGRSPGQLRAYWARQAFTGMGLPPRQVGSAGEANRFVSATPGAIGYVGRKEAESPAKIVLDAGK
jgi:ABC-type phosphate transport system substrate-binding protein